MERQLPPNRSAIRNLFFVILCLLFTGVNGDLGHVLGYITFGGIGLMMIVMLLLSSWIILFGPRHGDYRDIQHPYGGGNNEDDEMYEQLVKRFNNLGEKYKKGVEDFSNMSFAEIAGKFNTDKNNVMNFGNELVLSGERNRNTSRKVQRSLSRKRKHSPRRLY
jgi:hypothetical protein